MDGVDRTGEIRDAVAGLFAHRADKADAFAVRCAKEALLLPAVADGAARRIDPSAQGRFRDYAPLPHGSEQVVLADDALAVADRVFEEVENLWLEGDQRRAAPQLAPRRIQREIFKEVEQCTAPPTGDESTAARVLTSLTFRTMPVKVVPAIVFPRMSAGCDLNIHRI